MNNHRNFLKMDLNTKDFINVQYNTGEVYRVYIPDYVLEYQGEMKELSHLFRNKDMHIEMGDHSFAHFIDQNITVTLMKIGSNTFGARYIINNDTIADGVYCNNFLCIKNISSNENIAYYKKLISVAVKTCAVFSLNEDMDTWNYNDKYNFELTLDTHDYVEVYFDYVTAYMNILHDSHVFVGADKIQS